MYITIRKIGFSHIFENLVEHPYLCHILFSVCIGTRNIYFRLSEAKGNIIVITKGHVLMFTIFAIYDASVIAPLRHRHRATVFTLALYQSKYR